MFLHRKLPGFLLFILLLTGESSLRAQTNKALNDSLYKILLAFPSQFQSFKDRPASASNPNSFYSTITVPGIDFFVITKDPGSGSWEMEGTITSSDDMEEGQMEKLFVEWRKKLAAVILGGIRLKPYSDGRYSGPNKDEMYEEGYAWRLDNSRNNIAQVYRNFTIRLECLGFKTNFLVMRLLISDN